MESLSETYRLQNDVEIPCVGFGTWQISSDKSAVAAVLKAIQNGYRHIDTAAAYHNEKSVGEAVRKCGLPRQELFVTSKLWNSDQGYESALKAFDRTMKELQLDYLDLYLIHWPIPGSRRNDWQQANLDSWRAFEKLYQEGRIKAIGVSNFKPHHLKPLMKVAEIMPMVNQIELHPGMNQEETTAFCKEKNIIVEAWSPLARGKVSGVAELESIGKKYRKSGAQVSIRWVLQKGCLPLPKSVTPLRIIENAEVFDFELSTQEMQRIDHLTDIPGSGLDPDDISF